MYKRSVFPDLGNLTITKATTKPTDTYLCRQWTCSASANQQGLHIFWRKWQAFLGNWKYLQQTVVHLRLAEQNGTEDLNRFHKSLEQIIFRFGVKTDLMNMSVQICCPQIVSNALKTMGRVPTVLTASFYLKLQFPYSYSHTNFLKFAPEVLL